MKFLALLPLVFLFVSCNVYQNGNYTIKTEDPSGTYHSSKIKTIDEEEKIIFIDDKGVKHTFQGSYELYEE